MKIILVLLSSAFLVLAVTSAEVGGQRIKSGAISHTEWIGKALTEIEKIKPGMSRKDLLVVFEAEGGLSVSGTSGTFLYRQCPYIKVDVQFQRIRQTNESLKEFPDDKIINISRPYLGRPVID